MNQLCKLALMLSISYLSACSSAATRTDSNISLLGDWRVIRINQQALPDKVNVSINFDAQSAAGFAGCNLFRSTYQFDGQTLTISSPTLTRKHCRAEIMAVEHQVLNNLTKVTRVKQLEQGQLELLGEGENSLVLEKK